MELKSLVAMAAVAAALALAGSPSQAQPSRHLRRRLQAGLRQLPREGARQSIDLGPHGAKNDADGSHVPDLPRRRLRAPQGSRRRPSRPGPLTGKTTRGREDGGLHDCHSSNRHLAFWTSGKHAAQRSRRARTATASTGRSSTRATPASTGRRNRRRSTSSRRRSCRTRRRSAGSATSQSARRTSSRRTTRSSRGKVKCSDCHNPHGAHHAGDAETARRSTTSATRATPTSAVRTCSAHPLGRGELPTCHNPHGSVYARLLNENRAESLPGLPRRVAPSGHDLWRRRRLQLPAG